MTFELKQAFVTPDGKSFETKSEAIAYLRRPKIKEALMKVTGDNAELTDWLIENQETVEVAFETGTIRRVTASERKALAKALEAIKAINNSSLKFVQDNSDAILESFRHPAVKRMSEEEKGAAAKASLVAATGNEELANWILANKDAVLEGYEAGTVKREVNPKAAEALAAYRAKKAAEKAAQG